MNAKKPNVGRLLKVGTAILIVSSLSTQNANAQKLNSQYCAKIHQGVIKHPRVRAQHVSASEKATSDLRQHRAIISDIDKRVEGFGIWIGKVKVGRRTLQNPFGYYTEKRSCNLDINIRSVQHTSRFQSFTAAEKRARAEGNFQYCQTQQAKNPSVPQQTVYYTIVANDELKPVKYFYSGRENYRTTPPVYTRFTRSSDWSQLQTIRQRWLLAKRDRAEQESLLQRYSKTLNDASGRLERLDAKHINSQELWDQCERAGLGL